MASKKGDLWTIQVWHLKRINATFFRTKARGRRSGQTRPVVCITGTDAPRASSAYSLGRIHFEYARGPKYSYPLFSLGVPETMQWIKPLSSTCLVCRICFS